MDPLPRKRPPQHRTRIKAPESYPRDRQQQNQASTHNRLILSQCIWKGKNTSTQSKVKQDSSCCSSTTYTHLPQLPQPALVKKRKPTRNTTESARLFAASVMFSREHALLPSSPPERGGRSNEAGAGAIISRVDVHESTSVQVQILNAMNEGITSIRDVNFLSYGVARPTRLLSLSLHSNRVSSMEGLASLAVSFCF